jgi:hypothetical protein
MVISSLRMLMILVDSTPTWLTTPALSPISTKSPTDSARA